MSRSLPVAVFAAAVLAVTVLAAAPAVAEGEGQALPRFASLSTDKAYLRQGPGYAYRVLWIYHRKGLPVVVTDQFDVWRKVRLPDGTVGWVHVAMLSSRRTVVVTGAGNAPLRASASAGARVLALAAPGVIARLDHCEDRACEVKTGGTDGYLAKDRLWGTALTDGLNGGSDARR